MKKIIVFAVGMLTFLVVANSASAATAQAPAVPYTVGGEMHSTAALRGRPTLLWLLSTWCASCAVGVHALAAHSAEIEMSGLRVVILRNYHNGGYPGPDIRAFVGRIAPGIMTGTDWSLGEASAALEQAYNPRGYPDIYFLMDAAGYIQVVSGAPGVTMDKILRFARSQRNADAKVKQ